MLVALTGLAAFLVEHLAANLLVSRSDGGVQRLYAQLLSNPLIYVAEAGLVLLFVTPRLQGDHQLPAEPPRASAELSDRKPRRAHQPQDGRRRR